MDINTYLTFALLGLGAGAMYALLAQGVIIAYRGSGVVNFAHAAMALVIAYLFNDLHDRGSFFLPPLPNPLSLVEGMLGWVGVDVELWDIPTGITVVDGGMSVWLAALISMAAAVTLGWLVHVLIFRPIRSASPLTKVVASFGLMLLLQAVCILRFGPDPIPTQTLLPQDVVTIGSVVVPVDRFWFVGMAIIVTVALALLYKFTIIGVATRASAENERAAMLIGLSPNRLAGRNWMLAAALDGAAGILLASITGLDPLLVLLVIPALSAALIARFTSFTVAAIAGFGIGILQSLVLPLQSQFPWLPEAGLGTLVPFIVIAITMMVMGVGIPTRASATMFKLPRATKPTHPWRMTFILGAITLMGIVFLPPAWRAGIIVSLTMVCIAVSLYVLVGLAGQISLMQMAIVGMSALAMTRTAGDWGLGFPLAPLLAIVAGTLLGVITGLFAFRVRGVELAVLTLAGAWAFWAVVLGNSEILRGTDSAQAVPPPSIFGYDFGPAAQLPIGEAGFPGAPFGIFALLVAIGCTTIAILLRRGSMGLRFLAMRSNERAATALGIDLRINKMSAIAISSAIAAIAGVISAYNFTGITDTQYTAMASVVVLAAAFVGGISMISGVLVAGAFAAGGIMKLAIEHTVDYATVEIFVGALLLIMVAVQQPEGVAGFNEQIYYHLRDKYRAKRAARRESQAPDSLSAGPPADPDSSPIMEHSRQ